VISIPGSRLRAVLLFAGPIALALLRTVPAQAQSPAPDSKESPAATVTSGSHAQPSGFSWFGIRDFRRLWFEPRPWYDPLIADPRAAQISVIGVAMGRAFPYSLSTGGRPVYELSLGKELPILVRERGTEGDRPIAPGAWGFGYWFPVSMHVVGDLKDPRRPIVNTDYRFGVTFKLAHGLANHPRDKLSFKVEFGHESSHVGDEFLINARGKYPETFDRVDVTYQFLEGGASWDHLVGISNDRQLTMRVHWLQTVPATDKPGYYVPVTAGGRTIPLSRRNFEPGFGFEYAPIGARGGGIYVSLDVRNKTVFDFDRTDARQSEKSGWSYSFAFGPRSLNHAGRGTPELIIKLYYGVNPNGQFRTQTGYWLIGLGAHVRV
jgi:hypothetical protein